jgi:hypothetical protein
METLQHENRNFAEVGNDLDKFDYQKFEHTPLDLVSFREQDGGIDVNYGQTWFASARIYCPDVRVISRIAIVFQPNDPNDKVRYNLASLNNDIVAYRCINARSRIARVGEIIGKNGIPLQFPKSDIDGIAFQNDDDMPWIDIDLNLGFPGVDGAWTMFYHTTSNNKLKKSEWEGYISRVTMSLQSSPGTVRYNGGG